MKKLFTSLLSLLLFMPVSTVYAAGSDESTVFATEVSVEAFTTDMDGLAI